MLVKWKQFWEQTPSWVLSRRVSSFQRFFELGEEESSSPFLNQQAKDLSRNLALKGAALAAFFWVLAFLLRCSLVAPWWQFPLCFVYLLVGTPALVASVHDIVDRHDVNIDVLTSLAAFGALAIGSPFEGAMLLVLFAAAGSLEDLVTLRAKQALCSIYDIAPTKALVVLSENTFGEKAVSDVRVGERILVRSGEIVPLDGVVVRGATTLSLAHMTGESTPVVCGVSQTIVSGAKVLEGAIEIEVKVSSGDSTVAHLVSLITRAHSSKPKLSMAFDRWGRIYALVVISVTLALLVLAPFFLNIPFLGGEGSFVRAISFLITASPCALILAVPITYLSALGALAKHGAILKGSVVIDRIAACGAVAFDKTGTLTEGVLRLVDVQSLSGKVFDEGSIISYAASLERHAVHPVARALVDACSNRYSFVDVDNVQIQAGRGVSGTIVVGDQKLPAFVGSLESALSMVSHEEAAALYERRKRGSMLAVFVLEGHGYVISFEDTIRPESAKTVEDLLSLKKKVVMLTGDEERSAVAVGKKLHIADVRAKLLPEDKLKAIEVLVAEGGLLMVGDGINDAPALARSTVGVSMGQLSSAAAREASDVVLLKNDLYMLGWLFRKADQVGHVVRQNLMLALGSICIGVLTSVSGVLPLWAAVILHEGSTLVVGINALRLLSGPEKSSSQTK